MNTEGATTQERQLAEMLRRVTPEPPRGLTVEDVAVRVASQPGAGRRGHREAHARRGWPNRGGPNRGGPNRSGPNRSGPSRGWTRKWAPALAAGSVFVVISVSAGAVVGLNSSSHHSPAPAPGGQSTVTGPASSSASSPSAPQPSVGPSYPPKQVANGIWGAELIGQRKPPFTQDSLAGGAGSLYALAPGYLDRINPGTGQVVAQAPYPASGTEPPVVAGNTVWAVSSYAGADVVLEGFNGQTLASLGSVTVPVTGQLAGTPDGVMTSGPDGKLYVAAGSGVAVIDPATRQVVRRIPVSAGSVNSVAVSPDGARLYVSTGSFELLSYNLASGTLAGSSAIADIGSFGGNLVATAGGVWGTVGVGMTEWAWFAPDANLPQLIRITQGVGSGADSVPTFSGGTIWLGGSHTLECANPDTGQILASIAIPTDGGVLEHFGSVTKIGEHPYAYYDDQRAQKSGVAVLTPPHACSG